MDSMPKTRLRRTRTGCFKCRVRRRKCDEGKPTCKRCIDGGFECQYGTRISFLDKNARTTTGSYTSRSPKPAYAKLKFLVPESIIAQKGDQIQSVQDSSEQDASSTQRSPVEGDQDSLQGCVDQGELPTQQELEQQQQQQQQQQQHLELPPIISPNLAHFTIVSSPTDNIDSSLSHQPGLQNFPPYAADVSPSNAAYKTALDGLLSLGNECNLHVDNYDPPAEHGSHTATESHSDVLSQPLQTGTTGPVKPSSDLEFPNCRLMPQDRAINLMRHYRYHLARWLDIGDQDRNFGLVVPRIATTSEVVLNPLLVFTSATLGEEVDLSTFNDRHPLSTNESDANTPIVYKALAVAFKSLKRFYTTSPTSWQSPSRSIDFDVYASPVLSDQCPEVGLAASWLMLRLDISVGLINGSSVTIPASISYAASSPISSASRGSFQFDHGPLLLCAKVLNHCYGGNEMATSPSISPRPTASQTWASLSEALNMWYSNRPQDFKPMLEVDDDELFPLVLFTNGAAILANQLYHASMLLLLQNRPRTLPKEPKQHGRSVMFSPLWHAQRICGISLNNDIRANWDFSLLSSLYLAAQRMTYEPQQHAILRGISRIGNLTGWNTGALSVQLINEWQSN